MKKIYILTTYTGTVLSSIIKNMTKVPYAHVSIGMDAELNEVYSFGRKHVSNPIFAGFVREYIDDGLYKKKINTKCRVYSLEITDTQYKKIKQEIEFFVNNKNKFKYDAFALIRLLNNKAHGCEYKFVCSQFVAFVLEKSGINIFTKAYYSITPKDFLELEILNIEYEGFLRDYKKTNRDIAIEKDIINK